MRLTVQGPDPADPTGATRSLDVDVLDGLALRELRPHLAGLTGHAGWVARGARLAVGHRAVQDTDRCGQPPLVAGATLCLGRGHEPSDEAARRAPLHVAVAVGPDAGHLVGLEHRLVVGRRGPDDDLVAGGPRPARLALRDGLLSARHVELRGSAGTVRARDCGSANGTRIEPARRGGPGLRLRRARRLGPRWVRLRAGDRLHVGATVLEVRDPARADAPPTGHRAARPGVGTSAWTWVAPTVGSAALAATTGHTVLLLCALLAPALALVQLVGERRRARADPGALTPGEVAPAPLDDPAQLTWATLGAVVGTGAPRVADERFGPRHAIAVVGPRELALGAARWLALGAVGSHGSRTLAVQADPSHLAEWSWARWLAHPVPDGLGEPGVTLVDGPASLAALPAGTPGSVGSPRAAGAPDDVDPRLVLVAPTAAAVPAWCRALLHVAAGRAELSTDGVRRPVPLQAVGARWAETQARRVAGLRAGVGGAARPLPAEVALGDLTGVPAPDADAIARAWSSAPDGLVATLGADTAGPLDVDLVRDGPHALVAGTTGAGKSALLRTLVLSLALRHPPERLAIALVDYKGGASFGPCAALPQVVGQVTDLDGHLATRALTGLRAELRAREHAIAEAGCTDLAGLWAARAAGSPGPPPPPRLLVVVDEFRALAEEVPDFVPGLVRLAAQGRSLGMHLVLATQRPAGAVTPELRANIALRVALRVTDVTDSLDVLDAPDAAAVPADRPGRAVLRRGGGPLEHLQVARIRAPGARAPVRPAPPWGGADGGSPRSPADVAGGGARADDDEDRYVAAVSAAATGHVVQHPPWLPELPDLVPRAELVGTSATCVPDGGSAEGRRGVALALADVPDEQRRVPVRWDPGSGHLLVLGGPGSGRTTTLRTLAAGAIELGWDVHAIGIDLAPWPRDLFGTRVDPTDPRRLARLLTLLATRPPLAGGAGDDQDRSAARRPQLVLVDGLEAVLAALEPVARGAATERLLELLRDGRSRDVTLAVTAAPSAAVLALAGHFRDRLVLAVPDPVDQVLAGVPTELTHGRRPPGRAVHLGAAGARECQVAVVEEPPLPPAGGRSRTGAGGQVEPVLRLEPVPRRVRRADLGPTSEHDVRDDPGQVCRVPIGCGGDRAQVLRLDVSRGALVVGPGGSGRSTALGVLAEGLVTRGAAVHLVATDPLLTRLPGLAWCGEPSELATLLDHLEQPERSEQSERSERHGRAVAPASPAVPPAGPRVVMVDDLDLLDQLNPFEVERLARLTAGGAGSGAPPVRLVASVSTARAATAYREPLARLRALRNGLVLDAHEAGSADVFGVPLDQAADPVRGHGSGRGVLVHGREVHPVQVADLLGPV
ncbi:FtsK/SpoIIIE domain-containing protein [Cellulomonas sp. P22]|uniref:FtsK/SpoIIIE domain-containing protein n=1 Tax=Cellulomonas sp. P22 TaxID=3373189 RepID=UPI0037B6A5EE